MQDFEVNTMKRLKKGILFFLTFFFLLGLCSAAASRITAGCRGCVRGRSRVFAGISAEKKDSLDVIFLGDSESYTSFSPMDLWAQHGIASYNCGQSSQRIQETYYMLKTALQTQSPKLVILETNLMFRDPGLAENVLLTVGEPLRFYFPALRYHNIWKSVFDGPKTDADSFKGFPVHSDIEPYTGAKKYMQPTDSVKKMPAHTYLYMDMIRKLCAKNNASLLLVSTTSPVNYSYPKHNALAAYARRYNIPYFDLNLDDRAGIDWEKDTMDKGDHLNLSGARKVTAVLGSYLMENYSLPDHRGEKKYSDWNTLLEQYQTAADRTENG